MSIEKYIDLWILHLASSTGCVRVNPLKYRKPKWHNRLWKLSKKGWLQKERINCGDFRFRLTPEGKKAMKEQER